jgi:hypothetical protein
MKILGKFAYLHCYAIDMAYIQHAEHHAAPSSLRQRMYTTLRTVSLAVNGERGVRIMTMHPATPWDTVWKNLQDVLTSVEIQ